MSATAEPNATAPKAGAVPAADGGDDFAWDGVPGQELPPPPLFLLVVAEPGAGKTYLACTFPGPGVCLDSEHRANTVLRRFRNTFWKKVLTFDDIRRAIAWATKHSPNGTIIFDSGSDLNALAEAEVVAELNASKAKVHPTLHWTPVYERINKLCGYLRTRGWNVVFTARLSDEYENDKKTGKRAPSGFVTNKLLYQVDFAVQIVVRDGKRVGLVLKNGGKKPGTFATEIPDEALNYAGILKEFESEAVTGAPVPVGGPSIGPAGTVPPQAPSEVPAAISAPPPPAPATAPPVPQGEVAPAVAPAAAPLAPAPRTDMAPPAAAHPAVPTAPAELVGTAAPAGATTASQELLDDLATSHIAVDDLSKLHGFRKTGQVIEQLPLEVVLRLAGEWQDARSRGAQATMVQKEHELGRGGWFQEPARPGLVSPAEIAELEQLAQRLGATPELFWARAKARGWTKVRGDLTPERAREIRELLLRTKSGK